LDFLKTKSFLAVKGKKDLKAIVRKKKRDQRKKTNFELQKKSLGGSTKNTAKKKWRKTRKKKKKGVGWGVSFGGPYTSSKKEFEKPVWGERRKNMGERGEGD